MHGVSLDVNGSQIIGPVNGISRMQPPQPAADRHTAGQEHLQQQQRLEEHQRVSLQNIAQMSSSHFGSANISGGSNESYKDDSEEPRGRERSRDGPGGDMMEGSETSGNGQLGSNADTPTTRKRRRSRKGLDKKFECPHPGCGKSYSRAEHLYRHQLNRKTPLILHHEKKKKTHFDEVQNLPSVGRMER
jgi:hypothetical protein